jgi:hypothetical protein
MHGAMGADARERPTLRLRLLWEAKTLSSSRKRCFFNVVGDLLGAGTVSFKSSWAVGAAAGSERASGKFRPSQSTAALKSR